MDQSHTGRQRRWADQQIKAQDSLVLTHPWNRKSKMVSVHAHEGNSDKDTCCSARVHDKDRLTPRGIIAKRESKTFAHPFF